MHINLFIIQLNQFRNLYQDKVPFGYVLEVGSINRNQFLVQIKTFI